MKYVYTSIEQYVHALYSSINVYHPRQLDPELIASRVGLSVDYAAESSLYLNGLIIIDSRLSDEAQWQAFGHELCHALWHIGNQIQLPPPFRDYQEEKADQFARHACIPTSMLMQLNLPDHEAAAVDMLCSTFCVEPDFAQRRLHQYIRNHLQRGWSLSY